MTKVQHKAAAVVKYPRVLNYESREAMDRHDAAIASIMEAHEAGRHKHEVRHMLRLRNELGDWDAVSAYLVTVKRKRGDVAHDRLAGDIKSQWRAGNRGDPKDWREV